MRDIPNNRKAEDDPARIKYLIPASSGAAASVQVSAQRVQCHAQDFQPKKERNEVAACHQNHRTERCHQEQNVEFFASLRMALEIPIAENRDGKRGRNDQSDIEDCVLVQDEERRHLCEAPAAPPATKIRMLRLFQRA